MRPDRRLHQDVMPREEAATKVVARGAEAAEFRDEFDFEARAIPFGEEFCRGADRL